ncbi:MAG: IclR family transcriptional regulator [Pseudomonadota bacterium]
MGLQTLDRAMAALHALREAGPDGQRFVDLQQALGLSKPTLHRLLQSLLSHGLVQNDAGDRRYHLGQGLQMLARSVPSSGPDLRRICAPAVQCLAEASGDTVFLMARDGLFTLCVSRATGDYPIRAITADVGTRRPLGVGAGGIAILGELPVDEADRIVEVLAPRYGAYPLTSAEQIRKSHRQARRNGYSLSDEKVARGVRAVGIALHDASGAPLAAVGFAAIRQRVSTDRLPQLVALLKRERAGIEKALAAAAPAGKRAPSSAPHRQEPPP